MRTSKSKRIIYRIAVVICAVLFAVIYKWIQTGNPFRPDVLSETIGLGTVFGIVSLVGIESRTFFQKLFDKPLKQVKKIILPAFIIFMLVMLLFSLVVITIVSYGQYLIMGWDTSNLLSHLWNAELPGALRFYVVAVLVSAAFFFYMSWRGAIDREQRLREENLKYQYRTLKTQVNPHFLFNSLNTLSELVHTDVQKADNFIQKLSDIYRYILENEKKDLIPLTKEINFVRQYFELQKERNGNKIQLNIEVKNPGKYEVIPVSIQILVENALKHNAVSDEHPLKIDITDEAGYVVVANNMQRKSILNDSSGTGLPNLKERAKLITGREILVSQDNNQFTVKLPVVGVR